MDLMTMINFLTLFYRKVDKLLFYPDMLVVLQLEVNAKIACIAGFPKKINIFSEIMSRQLSLQPRA